MLTLCKGGSCVCRRMGRVGYSVDLGRPLRTLLTSFSTQDKGVSVTNFSRIFSFTGHDNKGFIAVVSTASQRVQIHRRARERVRMRVTSEGVRRGMVGIVPLFVLLCLGIASVSFLGILCKGITKTLFVATYLTTCNKTVMLTRGVVAVRV